MCSFPFRGENSGVDSKDKSEEGECIGDESSSHWYLSEPLQNPLSNPFLNKSSQAFIEYLRGIAGLGEPRGNIMDLFRGGRMRPSL